MSIFAIRFQLILRPSSGFGTFHSSRFSSAISATNDNAMQPALVYPLFVGPTVVSFRSARLALKTYLVLTIVPLLEIR